MFEHVKKARSIPRRSEIRKDYIQEKYVIIAPIRGKRPQEIAERVMILEDGDCVFSSKNVNKREDIILRVPDSKKWKIAVVPNLYPAVSLENRRSFGIQEVVIETPRHEVHLEELPARDIVKILEVYAARTKVISKNKKIQYILIFKNSGGRAGASIRHAHSQIFATSFLPPHILDKSERVMAFKLEHKTCAYCEVARIERRGARFIGESNGVVAFAPYASMHNYEAWIMPKRHLDNIGDLNPRERMGMAKLLKKILYKINLLKLPYNYYFHQVVSDFDQHLYLKITPRGTIWAGVEIGSGLIINPVSPEDAAEYYRK